MDNHHHLVMETPKPNLVRGMHRLNGVYTQAFNRRHNKVGFVFQWALQDDRGGRLVPPLELCRYMVLNPARAKVVQR